MRTLLPAAAAALLLTVGCTGPGSGPDATKATQASVAAHVQAATAAAGGDLQSLMALCRPAPATRPPQEEVEKLLATMIARPVPQPAQAFDNLYYVGADWVSAWVLKTSEGLILIDALNNAQEAETVIDAGMRKLGLDPKDIRYVLVTHGHGDHYGGLQWLRQRYDFRIVMSERDWAMTETGLEFDSVHWGPAPRRLPGRDIATRDGDTLRLGDTTVTLVETPGHTLGTVSPVFDVRAGGRTHRAMLWGGTAFNFGKDLPRLEGYIGATDKIARLAKAQDVEVMLSNHAGYDRSLAFLAAMRAVPRPPANPFLIGQDAVQRSLTVMRECAMAQRDRFML